MISTDVLVAAERAFASAAAGDGMRAAFLQFLAHDSILFRPEPVDGLTWFEKQPASPGLLSWSPEFAEMAASGDIGFTTGPWNFRESPDTDPIQHGQYVSIWRRRHESLWKVVIDVGVTYPSQTDDSAQLQIEAIDHEYTREYDKDGGLLEVEANLAAQVRQSGYPMAFQQYGAANIWVLRTGHPPFRGFLNLADAFPAHPMNIEWKIFGVVVAANGDLAYVYGTRRLITEDQVNERCSFLRIWRWGEQDRWELALDIENPFPAGT